MRNRTQDRQQASASLSNIPRMSQAGPGPRKDSWVQTNNVEDKGHEVHRLRERERQALKSAHSIKIKLDTTTRRLEKAQADLVASNQRAKQMETQLHDAERRAKETVAHLSRELLQCQSKLEKKAALLDTRSAELRDAQAYLALSDDVTDTEVLQLVNGINSRIYQVAANIADAFQPRYGEQQDVQVMEEAVARLQAFLDGNLLLALNTIHHADDHLVLQIALQAIIVSCAGWLCNTWNDAGCPLRDIYQAIRGIEPQSIAGRWRALSRTYVKTLLTDDEDPQLIATNDLLDCITEILLANGISAPRDDLRMEIERGYADRLREVIHTSHEVQCITGERVISRDLSIVTVDPKEQFDSSRMVDEWADPKRARRGVECHPVLCTTQLGLAREERKTTERTGGEVGFAEVLLLKPTVVLQSLLEELSD